MDAKYIWVIYFVGFDDATSGGGMVEPRVGFERVATTTDAQEQEADAQMTALCRGGQLLSIVESDDEKKAAELAAIFSKDILRMR